MTAPQPDSLHYGVFGVYFLGPNLLFGWFYGAYLVKRFGGTPGKLLMGIRIRKVDGSRVGSREAVLRYLPEGIIALVSGVLLLQPPLLTNRRRRALHDFIAGTVVVHSRQTESGADFKVTAA
jgi:uncharacterized RDD family membrane protein YckC